MGINFFSRRFYGYRFRGKNEADVADRQPVALGDRVPLPIHNCVESNDSGGMRNRFFRRRPGSVAQCGRKRRRSAPRAREELHSDGVQIKVQKVIDDRR